MGVEPPKVKIEQWTSSRTGEEIYAFELQSPLMGIDVGPGGVTKFHLTTDIDGIKAIRDACERHITMQQHPLRLAGLAEVPA